MEDVYSKDNLDPIPFKGVEYVFVYGTLRKGCPQSHKMKNCEYIKTTRLYGLRMYDSFYGFPVIERTEDVRDYIVVDVFRLPSNIENSREVLKDLDFYEGYKENDLENSLFVRELVNMEGDYGYIYLGSENLLNTVKGVSPNVIKDWKSYLNQKMGLPRWER